MHVISIKTQDCKVQCERRVLSTSLSSDLTVRNGCKNDLADCKYSNEWRFPITLCEKNDVDQEPKRSSIWIQESRIKSSKQTRSEECTM